MPMPTLDPSRFYAAVLADPSHKLPLPGPGAARFFSAEGEVVDSADPFYGHLLADGSLVRKTDEAEASSEPGKPVDDPAPETKAETPAPTAPKAVVPAPAPAKA
jgi:hypothetical protein